MVKPWLKLAHGPLPATAVCAARATCDAYSKLVVELEDCLRWQDDILMNLCLVEDRIFGRRSHIAATSFATLVVGVVTERCSCWQEF